MAEITAQMVKQLRDMTGAGMMECKKALQETNGDLQAAVDELRKRGLSTAAKKAGRSTKQGIIGTLIEGSIGVVIEVNCESDFVARTDEFQGMVKTLAKQVADKTPADVAALMAQPYAADPSSSVEEMLKAKIAKVGENMKIPRFARYQGKGVLSTYTHPGAQLATLVDLTVKNPATASNPVFAELIHDIAMQVAAADPKFLDRGGVTTEFIDREKAIQRDRALAEGKPEKMVDKIVEGRMSKFYEEVCLLEQPFIKENSVTITQLLADKSKAAGDDIRIAGFVRFKVGETAAAEEPAAE
jgi:elongation factor Ts